MRTFRTYNEVDPSETSTLLEQVLGQKQRLAERLSGIGALVAVVSGKGGVGKSAITANLAMALTERGASVGVVDADLNGPSLGRMLGVSRGQLLEGDEGIQPAIGVGGIKVVTMEFLQEAEDAPLRWKGPQADTFIWQSVAEAGVLREFLGDLCWGQLDYLLIDLPPGTDKIIRLLELVPTLHQAIVVTTPSAVASSVVARSVTVLSESEVPAVGLVANMTGLELEGREAPIPLFPGDGVEVLIEQSGIDLWAKLPFDPLFGGRTDVGELTAARVPDSSVRQGFEELSQRVERGPGGREAHS